MNDSDPHIVISVTEHSVFIQFDDVEFQMSKKLARYVGDELFKAGWQEYKDDDHE